MGPVFAAVIVAEIGDLSRFPDAGHLAAYAGVAPSKRQSGSGKGGSKKRSRCNRILKGAFCESAWIAIQHDKEARRFFEKKLGEGKTHKQAILALARHRVDVVYAMLRTGSAYGPKAAAR